MSCLAVDVGNTSAALGAVSKNGVRCVEHVEGGIGNITDVEKALERIRKRSTIKGVILGSVVPNDNIRWIKLLRRVTGQDTFLVSHTAKLSVSIDYPKPTSIGADRLANACGAVARHGSPVIVADFGTALTFDVIAGGGVYVGGVIAPGLPLMTDYLADRTALLPLISLKGRCHSVGRSTEGAMRIGARIGYRGMVREIIAHLIDGLGSKSVALCATGGFAKWVLNGAQMPFSVEPNLTLEGLGRIFDLNCNP